MAAYGSLRLEIQRLLGGRDDPETQAIIRANFNHVQRMLARGHRWPELEATHMASLVSRQRDYTHGNLGLIRFHKHYSLVLATPGMVGRLLDYVTPAEWDTTIGAQAPTAAMGRPHLFTYWRKAFSFFRTPDSAYPLVIRYYQYPPSVINDASPIVFENIDELLVFATVGYCWASLGEIELAMTWQRRAAEIAQGIKVDSREILDWTPPTERRRLPVSEYWRDPFVKRMP